jgi:hypothetical protein
MGRARDLANILSSSGNVALDSELGLSLITPTSITTTGGSGSISLTGGVSFTSASAISLNGIFTSTYKTYMLNINLTSGTSDAALYLKMRASGTDNSTNYYYAMNNLKTNNTANNYYATNGTSGFLIGEIDGPSSANNWNFASIVLCNPQLTLLTNFTSTGTSLDTGGSVNGHSGGGTHALAASYDAVSLIVSAGTITGSISIYGYRN